MNNFDPFDPLKAKLDATTEAQVNALKREIKNILKSYVGWYDPFSEVIQNAIDSVEKRSQINEEEYQASIWITINIKDNYLAVTDNGIGLSQQQFEQFLAPYFSFKSGNTRGRKGVGVTYLAYGFNSIQLCTKTEHYNAVGKMINAKDWVEDESPAANPQVVYDQSGSVDEQFQKVDSGVSICVKFGKNTYPSDLNWIQINNASSWMKVLKVKTAIGAIIPNQNIKVCLKVVDRDGVMTKEEATKIEYLWTNEIATKSASVREIKKKRDELYNKGRNPDNLPSYLTNLEVIYDNWNHSELLELAKDLKLEEDDLDICKKYTPTVYCGYVFSTKKWEQFNNGLNVRNRQRILYGGIQIAANNMPQGELIQIPLTRNIGRQNNAHFIIHFNNCEPDLGRKGFQNEIVNFSKNVASKLVDVIFKHHKCLKPTTGATADLLREESISDWKNEMLAHEKSNPLKLINENFFLPTKVISITSIPTREQDVIALFNQLIAGGVIRGIRIMSTNERFTYDGLYKVIINEPTANHIYEEKTNPLGILEEIVVRYRDKLPFESFPKVLEYKYSLDGLIEDINSGIKNSNDIGLIVVWETGSVWKGNYKITSLLDWNNLSLRQYHGVTHTMTNLTTNQREMDLIVLKELIDYLNDSKQSQVKQIEKYEEED